MGFLFCVFAKYAFFWCYIRQPLHFTIHQGPVSAHNRHYCSTEEKSHLCLRMSKLTENFHFWLSYPFMHIYSQYKCFGPNAINSILIK